MLYQISSHNLELTESMRFLAQEKVGKLERFFKDQNPQKVVARITMGKGVGKGTFESQIEISWAGQKVVGNETAYTLENSLIKAVEEVRRQIAKLKAPDNKAWEERRKQKMSDGLSEKEPK